MANNRAIFDAINTGKTPHYVFIFDRTDSSRDAVMKRSAPEDLRSRLTAPAFKLWERHTGYQFVALLGSFGASGGLTMPTVDINALIEKTLPAIMKRNNEIGGLCSRVPSAAPEFRPLIEQKLAELQPIEGAAQ
ncbi:hypothetical protein AB4Y35_18305 [Paraburkholderia sp. EG286A]|uniref:hypothetical protein n=1 Tax=Paraburkholderia sp. EG286A TaxID=3237014 RepID=UPI0034D2AD8F